MSLATLKRKTRHNPRVAPISGRGVNGFSLQGTHRNIGGVGQFRMISNVTRTPFNRNGPKGNGGRNGQYYNQPLNSGSCCTNDDSIVKLSTKNTKGLLSGTCGNTNIKCNRTTYHNNWVQEDDNSYRITRDQGQYIEKQTKSSGQCVFVSDGQADNTCKTECAKYIGSKKQIFTQYAKNLNILPISQGQYIRTGGVSKNNGLPTCAKRQPFPMKLNNEQSAEGCNTYYTTWEEARDAGLLPADYVG